MSENGPSSPEPTQPIEGRPQSGWTPPDYGTQPGYGTPSYGQQQPGSYPPPAQPMPGQMPGQMPPQWQPRQDDSGATPALVVGIVGLALGFIGAGLGFLVSPVAMVLGWRSKRRIDASQGRLGGRGNAQAGFILGLIGTIFLVLGILFLLLIIGLLAGGSGGTF